MRWLKVLFASALIVMLSSGCSSKTEYGIKVKETQNLFKDSSKSYIVFARSQSVDEENPVIILEYMPSTNKVKTVNVLNIYDKGIYEVDEGSHYFYALSDDGYDFIRVDTKSSNIYFVETLLDKWVLLTKIYLEKVQAKKRLDQFEHLRAIEPNVESFELVDELIKDDEDFYLDLKKRFELYKKEYMSKTAIRADEGVNIEFNKN